MGRDRKIEKLSLEEYLYLKGYLKNQMSLYKVKNRKGGNKFANDLYNILLNNDLFSLQKVMQEINQINANIENGVNWAFLVKKYRNE